MNRPLQFFVRGAAIGAIVALAACATTEPVPKDYAGPTATLRDSGVPGGGSKSQMFAAVEIDGHGIRNAFGESAMASRGLGNLLISKFPERKVKATAMKVALRCSHVTGAPIAAFASQLAGTFYSVEGEVDFSPSPGGRYVVKGELTREQSSCWIEDEDTSQPVTRVITTAKTR